MSLKAGIAAALVCLFTMLGSTVPAQARSSCDKRMRKAEDNLRKEIRKHGEYSSQAQYRRRQLEEVRQSCGFDRDHDRDRDRDRDNDRDHDRGRHHRHHDRDKDRDHDHDHDHDGR